MHRFANVLTEVHSLAKMRVASARHASQASPAGSAANGQDGDDAFDDDDAGGDNDNYGDDGDDGDDGEEVRGKQLAFDNAGSGEAEEYDEDHLPEDGTDHYSFSHTRHGVAFRHGGPAAASAKKSTRKSAKKSAKKKGGKSSDSEDEDGKADDFDGVDMDEKEDDDAAAAAFATSSDSSSGSSAAAVAAPVDACTAALILLIALVAMGLYFLATTPGATDAIIGAASATVAVPYNAVAYVFGSIISGVSSGVGGVTSGVSGAIGGITSGITSGIASGVGGIGGIASGFGSGLAALLPSMGGAGAGRTPTTEEEMAAATAAATAAGGILTGGVDGAGDGAVINVDYKKLAEAQRVIIREVGRKEALILQDQVTALSLKLELLQTQYDAAIGDITVLTKKADEAPVAAADLLELSLEKSLTAQLGAENGTMLSSRLASYVTHGTLDGRLKGVLAGVRADLVKLRAEVETNVDAVHREGSVGAESGGQAAAAGLRDAPLRKALEDTAANHTAAIDAIAARVEELYARSNVGEGAVKDVQKALAAIVEAAVTADMLSAVESKADAAVKEAVEAQQKRHGEWVAAHEANVTAAAAAEVARLKGAVSAAQGRNMTAASLIEAEESTLRGWVEDEMAKLVGAHKADMDARQATLDKENAGAATAASTRVADARTKLDKEGAAAATRTRALAEQAAATAETLAETVKAESEARGKAEADVAAALEAASLAKAAAEEAAKAANDTMASMEIRVEAATREVEKAKKAAEEAVEAAREAQEGAKKAVKDGEEATKAGAKAAKKAAAEALAAAKKATKEVADAAAKAAKAAAKASKDAAKKASDAAKDAAKEAAKEKNALSAALAKTKKRALSATECNQVAGDNSNGTACPQRDDFAGMIDDALKRYDADRIGRPDFAIKTAGGRVVKSLTSPSYVSEKQPGWTRLVGSLSIVSLSEPPETAISPTKSLGECWAFGGTTGSLTIKLPVPVKVTAVTIDHVSPSVAHDIRSAPKDFIVETLTGVDDANPLVVGRYVWGGGGASGGGREKGARGCVHVRFGTFSLTPGYMHHFISRTHFH